MWSAILGIVFALLKWGLGFFSDTAKLHRKELAEAKREGREAVEAERLEATYGRIEREPPPTNLEDLASELKKRFPPRPPR